ncbi:hypothetical protein M378DRAFT_160966 [Amanita muscaria Koide BX008]|uniref:Uncharacterized protein n=1 Tax=Amanita muscaria (strain Koide BX008) TaxID=946122 RepID=A0A0C2XAZ8_AMAMK|nr:hypothetical protein M378DRAFT_160966 [Amanita muscaria Koide BX008]
MSTAATATFHNYFFDPLQLIIDGHESKELKHGEEYEGQAGSYSVKLNDLEIFSINYGGVSALTIQLFEGRPRPPLLEVRNKTASQLHLMSPGAEESVVIEANGASASQPRIAGKFSINHGSSEGVFFARQNVNILAI